MTDETSADAWQQNLSIVIPTFNEHEGLGLILPELRQHIPLAEILVVDDGSTDGSSDVAASFAGVRVLKHASNRGYGAALKTGMREAARKHVAWIDADGEYSVDDLIIIAKRIEAEALDAVFTWRRQRSRSMVRFVGKWLIRTLSHSINTYQGQDGNSGLRVFRTSVITRYLSILPNAFSASMTSTIVMYEQKHAVGIQSIDSHERVGESKVRIADGFTTLALVLRLVMLFAPLRIFLRAGSILVAVGLIYGLTRAILERHGIPTAALLLILTGILLWIAGLIADQIGHMRLALIEMQAEMRERKKRDD
jgi:glycosyltransferase involved in cell wall biosynthesis